jgi:Tol biopolymer transport system component
MLGLGASVYPQLSVKGLQLQATPSNVNNGLAYLESDASGHSKLTHKPQPLGDQSSTIAEPSIPAGCSALGVYASPHGPWLATDVTCEASGSVQVINVASGKTVDLDPALTQDSTFINWAPTGNEIILRTGNLPDSRIYLIQINNGRYQPLPVPNNVYDVALSTNGRRMIYSLTWGLGQGSETWIADIDGGNARRVLSEPNHIVAFANWSPSEKEIAYIRMPDSNIPFTIGELWVMDGQGQNPTLLGNADAGHGFRPTWSPDDQEIAFVVREQKGIATDSNDNEANFDAQNLISNIYIAKLSDKSISSVTNFDGALTESPIWSPEGQYLAFNTSAGGEGIDIWVLDRRSSVLSQITHGQNARFPVWLSIP